MFVLDELKEAWGCYLLHVLVIRWSDYLCKQMWITAPRYMRGDSYAILLLT